MKRSFAVIAFACVVILALGVAACQPSTAADRQAASVSKAPDFVLPEMDGRSFRLSDAAGKVVLLDFFATWCPPCRMEVPHLQKLHEDYGDKGLVVVGISLDQGGVEVVRPFVQANGVTYTTVMGSQSIADSYGGIRGIPTLFLIDRNGNIARKFVGYQDKAVLEAEIKKLL